MINKIHQFQGINTRFESGLKLVLGKFDMERLYDFEEEGVEGLMRSKVSTRNFVSEKNMEAIINIILDK